MENLPEELLHNIFSHIDMKSLASASQVCTVWRDVASRRTLNTLFVVSEYEDILFIRDCPRAIHVETFIIKMEVLFLQEFFKELSKICPNITSMTIMENRLGKADLQLLHNCLPKLKRLDIQLNNNRLDPVFSNIYRALKMVAVEDYISKDVDFIFERVPKSEHDCRVYESVCSFDVSQFDDNIKVKYEHVTKLTIKSSTLKDYVFYSLADCVNLENLHLYHCWLMTDRGLTVLSSFEHLRVLKLTGLPKVTSEGITNFLNTLNTTNLTELNLNSSSFNDLHISLLLEKGVPLTKLSLWNTDISIKGVERILRGFRNLRFLNTSICYSDALWAVFKETKIAEIQFLDRLLTYERLGEYSQSVRKSSESLDHNEFESLMYE